MLDYSLFFCFFSFTQEEEKKFWSEAKSRAEEEEERKARECSNDQLRLFRLSRQFPMFNDKAVPAFTMDNVVER